MINILDDDLSHEARNILLAIKKKLSTAKRLSFERDKNLLLDFRDYRSLKELFRYVHYKKQKDGFNVVLNALNSYNSRKPEHLKGNKNLLDNAKKLCDGRKIIIDSLKNKVPPF